MKKLLLLIALTTVCLTTVRAQIPVGTGGSGTLAFPTFPTVAEGWSTVSIGGGSGDFAAATTFDATLVTVSASAVTTPLGSSPNVNPPTQDALFRWNSANLYLQSRPTGNGYNLLLATLRNDSATDISTITINYDHGIEVLSGQPLVEQIPGHRVFWSLTGAANSWTLIPALSGATSVGNLSALVNIWTWSPAFPLYLLWADDNGTGGNTVPGNQEGVYTIDNFSVTISGSVAENVTVSSPTNTAPFPLGAPITVSANASLTGTVSAISFYRDGVLIGSDTASPYSVIYSNATLGTHQLSAVGTDETHSVTSAVVNITVVANNLPIVTLTSPINGRNFPVGVTVSNVTASASDSGGSVTRVEFYLDGGLWTTDTTSPYSFDLGDITAGTHAISAVAVDNSNARRTNSISIVATNPPGLTVLIPNGSTWKYKDDGTDQTNAMVNAVFDDSGWSDGVAEFGYGDGPRRAERTVVSFGPNVNQKYATTYFRKTFNVSDPFVFGSLSLNVLADDHFIVYINGNLIFTDIALPVSYTNHIRPNSSHDGTVYTNIILSTSVLTPGDNVVAVELHQDSATSTDISFDLMLWGLDSTGPTLIVNRISSTQVELVWPIVADGAGALLYFKTDLGATGWTPETGGVDNPSGGFHRLTVSSTSTNKFWTLRVP